MRAHTTKALTGNEESSILNVPCGTVAIELVLARSNHLTINVVLVDVNPAKRASCH
jgi:ubiquinone/menaquinone biosynthesis C-methylase UbiE